MENIKSEELRIGNYVIAKIYTHWDLASSNSIYKDSYQKVEGIYHSGINPQGGGFYGAVDAEYEWKELFGIPITPDILLKCGFENGSYHTNYFYHPELTPHIIQLSDGYKMEAVDDIHVANYFHYLHQLQNLYFALTNKELEIKL